MVPFLVFIKNYLYLCSMEKILVICRGICGAGKSTFAKTLGGQHYEADMYFIDPTTGEYKFDGTKIKNAHAWCLDRVKTDMAVAREKIVVSNTFTQEWEMEPYFELAKKYGYKVFSLIVENRHEGTNEHNVPEDKIEQMKNRFSIKL
jgi:predicted kinase